VGLLAAAFAILAAWLLVLAAEYVWAALATVIRRALVMRSSWAEFDVRFERHCLGYLRHKAEVDAYLAEREREADVLQAEAEKRGSWPEIRERLLARMRGQSDTSAPR
jgi:hypothetical protein